MGKSNFCQICGNNRADKVSVKLHMKICNNCLDKLKVKPGGSWIVQLMGQLSDIKKEE